MFAGMESGYKKILHYSLDHRAAVLGGALILLVISLFLMRFIGREYLPQTDEGEVNVNVEMEVGTRLMVMDQKLREVTALVKQYVPEISILEEGAGSGGWRGGANQGNITIRLKPKSERTRASAEIAADLSRRLSQVPGALIRTRVSGGQMMFGMRGGGGQERIQVRSGVTIWMWPRPWPTGQRVVETTRGDRRQDQPPGGRPKSTFSSTGKKPRK
jgi:HAE1 family hydrophobic/amphiphilic exporter-1